MTNYALSWDANVKTIQQCHLEAQRETDEMVEFVQLSNDSALTFPVAEAGKKEKSGGKTKVVKDSLDPVWNQAFAFKDVALQFLGNDDTRGLSALSGGGVSVLERHAFFQQMHLGRRRDGHLRRPGGGELGRSGGLLAPSSLRGRRRAPLSAARS